MRSRSSRSKILVASAVVGAGLVAQGGEGPGGSAFVRDKDVWAFLGDSITHADTYRHTLERVLQHYHPEATIRCAQGGQPGALATASRAQFTQAAATERPTLVSLMTGMNNSINSDWRQGQPLEKPLAGYRQQLTDFVRAARSNNVDVVLMSPTLTDESLGWGSMWALDGTAEFLRRCGRIAAEVAAAEGAVFVPVAEDVEAVQQALRPEQVLRHDGVHPSARGQYAIARSLLRHMNFAGPLAPAAPRRLAEPPPSLPLEVTLASRFLHNGDTNIALVLTAGAAFDATVTWSGGATRGREPLKLAAGTNTWTLRLPAPLNLEAGAAGEYVLDVTDGRRMGLYLLDLCHTRVLHPRDGKVSGEILGAAGRPEGRKAVAWTLDVHDGKTLDFEAEVFDAEIRTDAAWPWGQDGLQVWLDYRPADRFADGGLDSDVYMVMLLPRTTPWFTVGLRPWLGRGIYGAATAGGEKTATGYRCRLSIADGEGQMRRFSKWQNADLSQRDFLGFSLIHTDLDTDAAGKPTAEFNLLHKTQYPHDKYANTLMIVDLRDKLPGESVINAQVTRLLP